MKRYLVGGAMRDELLGRPVHEHDWVVVGETEEQMHAAGYLQVAERMPVFLDPELREEHALARLEKKTGAGHKGFLFTSSPEVTLEEDLMRRDLTINAIARSEDGEITDPCGGREDLQRRLLRHISPAFAEDPLRVLRVARFAAELAEYGFQVVPETLALMEQVVHSGELQTLPTERLWRETQKALQSGHPQAFFRTLQQCRALPVLFAGLDERLKAVQQNLALATAGHCDAAWRWAAIAAALDEEDAESLQTRLRPPGHFSRAARLAVRLLPQLQSAEEPQDRLAAFEGGDAFRRPGDFNQLLQLADALQPDFDADGWQQALQQVAAVKLSPDNAPAGAAYGKALHSARLQALTAGMQSR